MRCTRRSPGVDSSALWGSGCEAAVGDTFSVASFTRTERGREKYGGGGPCKCHHELLWPEGGLVRELAVAETAARVREGGAEPPVEFLTELNLPQTGISHAPRASCIGTDTFRPMVYRYLWDGSLKV